VNWVDVSVLVEITSLLGMKLAKNVGSESVRFDVNAKLEEKERRSGRVVVSFALTVRTKPSVVKYEIEGNATLIGKDALIEKILEVDSESKIPHVFHRVYQHVFTAIYMLASLLGTIYPPPDLLSSGGQGIPVQSLKRPEQMKTAEKAETAETPEQAQSVETARPAETVESAESEELVKPEETATQQTRVSAT